MFHGSFSAQLLCGCKRFVVKCYRHHSSKTENQKVLTVALLGEPNAGKSSLVNNIVGARVSAVTHIAHTTRNFANGILNVGDTQLIFTDTPGAVSYQEGRRLKMHKNQIRAPRRVAASADILAVVTDVSNRKTKSYIGETVLEIMDQHSDIPAILILNKIDLLKKKEELIFLASLLTHDRKKDEWGYELYGGSSRFQECFFTCARNGDGVDQLIDYLVSKAKYLEWHYSADIFCDSSVDVQIAEVFREKLMVIFAQEIPWQVKQETILFQNDYGIARIHQKLTWPKKSQRRYVLTKEEELTKQCLDELEKMFQCPVNLTIEISQKKNMTHDDILYF